MKRDYVWTEKYRPQTLSEYVCTPEMRERIQGWIKEANPPNLLLAGPAGTGKTTLARLLAKAHKSQTLELNASDERGIDVLRDKVKRFAMMQTTDQGKTIILDEFDHVTLDFQTASRGVIENYSKGTLFILTCNFLNRIIDPIQSRCKVVKIAEMPKKEMARRAATILLKEKVKFKTEDLKEVVQMFYPDMRKVLNTLQSYSRNGELKIDYQDIVDQDFKLKIWENIQKKALNEIRQIISNEPVDFVELYRFLFQRYYEEPEKHRRHILNIAEYLWRDGLVPDKEINFMACVVGLIELS